MATKTAIEDSHSPLSPPAVVMDSTEEQEDPPNLATPKRSWVAVAQKEKVLKKYEYETSISEGKQSIEVPSIIVEKANPLWEDFVVVKFLETAPHIAKVHVILNKIWAFGDKDQKLDVYEMDSTTMRVRIISSKVRDKVVRRGMWNIAGVPMVVSKWSPDDDPSKASLVPLWVHLTNVPMNMYSWEGLSFITSAAGVPDHLHPETVACTNFDIAKVFVKADLTKDLPKKINYTIQGKEVEVHFNYPWLPPKCTICGRWGHYATFCKEGQKVEVVKAVDMNEDETKRGNIGEQTRSSKKKSSNKEELETEKLHKKDDKSEEKEGKLENEDSSEEGEIKTWEKVSQEKASRTPKSQNLKYGQVTIATPSRYAALTTADDNEEDIEQEEVEVAEINDTEMVKDISLNMMIEEAFKKSAGNKGGNTRVILPRQSKTNHRVVPPETSLQAKDTNLGALKKGSRKNH